MRKNYLDTVRILMEINVELRRGRGRAMTKNRWIDGKQSDIKMANVSV